jgi:hypothetical protein
VAVGAAEVVEAPEAAAAAEAAWAAAGAAVAAVAGGGEAAGEAVAAARPGGLAAGARHKLIHVRKPRVGMAGVERLGPRPMGIGASVARIAAERVANAIEKR